LGEVKVKKFLLLAGFSVLAISAFGGGGSVAPTSNGTTTAKADFKAMDVAAIGDEVTIPYPSTTYLCGDRNDAQKIYIAGVFALNDSYRLERSARKAVEAEFDAQKRMVRSAYSCEMAPRDKHYIVVHKEVVGNDKTPLHSVEYCVSPIGKQDCWWTSESATSLSPKFERVTKAVDKKA
jgi:hypothetical protein